MPFMLLVARHDLHVIPFISSTFCVCVLPINENTKWNYFDCSI